MAARDHWDSKFGDLATAVRNWQLFAYALVLLVGLEAAAVFHFANQSNVVPYVVTVSELGQPVAFGPVEPLRDPDERLQRYLLSMWIFNTRTVITDAIGQKELLFDAYEYLDRAATPYLNSYFQRNPPFARAQNGETVTVRVHTILRQGEKSWQIQWTETVHDASASKPRLEAWQAILETKVEPPQTTDAILSNPLGLYITSINWTKVS